LGVLAGYIAWMAALIIVHYTLPGARFVTWALIGASGIIAMLAGITRNRPPWKVPWLVLALANACALAGQLIAKIMMHTSLTAVSAPVAMALYFVEYPLYVLGLILIIRAKGLAGDLRSTIDSLIITIGLGLLLAWLFLIHPHEIHLGLSAPRQTLAVAYPVGDVITVGVLARLLTPGVARGRVLQLLVIGTIGALISDVAIGWTQIYGMAPWHHVFSLGWAIGYTAWGAATLHPDFRRMSSEAARQGEHQKVPKAVSGRMIALLVTALIPPVFLLVRTSLAPQNQADTSAAAASALLSLLVLSRLWDVNISHERSLERERALRMAGAALASSTTIDGIGTIVRKAIMGLIGQGPNREALFAVRTDDELSVVTTCFGSSGGKSTSDELASLVPHWLPRLRLFKSAEPRLMRAADLPAEQREATTRAGFESVLLCPLVLTNRPSGDPLIGVLAVLGEQRMLSDMSSVLGIVANQVALALERVLLSEEVVRQRGEALFRTLVQDALDVILVLDDDGIIKYASPSATRLYGDVPVKGVNADTLVAETERVKTHQGFDPATSEDVYGGLYRITRHDGQRLLVEVRFTDLRHDESVQGRVLTIRDVTEENKLEDQLKYQAFHDTLTGLPNRALFTDRAEHAIAVAQRNQSITAVLFVDLDDFKVVNDSMGHAVGDELLAGVAERLSSVTRKSDTAARFGGDEFALLIESLPDPQAAEAFADRVITAFTEPFELSGGSVLAGATVGVATTADSSDVGELMQHADLSLYAAKSEGKRRWHRYTSVLSAGINKRREMQERLEETVARSAFTLAYQPIVELATGAIQGFEALVRWPHPVRGTVPPSEFIELAEETGLIVPLGAWILKQAIADMSRWRGTDPDPRQPDISVNVSARQFRDPGFVGGLRRCLDETGLVPSAVVLELTESSLLRRDERIRSDLAELKDLGVRLSIDDFGTGYSSLAYVRELPIDILKIDKAFVDVVTEPQGRKFAEIIISFARAIEVEVVAEGIETEEQRSALMEMGCRVGQGYLLAMPMEWRAAEVLLRSGRPLTREESRRGASWQLPLLGDAGRSLARTQRGEQELGREARPHPLA
jgi:diguanylate cyclase (GGDEF)-like protein/PAS domain S-box-containing protein